jgi:hypothetical protein
VKRVVLYKNGVGYFEHVGQVRGNQEVTIPFTSGQLNDVLKSLTMLDLGGGRITGVAYGSAAPVDRQLGDLRLPVGEKSSLTEFLNALRGARLEIKSGAASMTGRLLSVERKTRIAGGTTLEHPVRTGYTLRSETKPEETTADWMRFRLRVDPKQTAALVVEEARPVAATYQLTNVDERQVELFVRQQSINKAVEDALRRILARKDVVAELDSRKEARDAEMKKIFDDQQRLRENMKALKGSSEEKLLVQRYTQQLNGQETRLDKLGKEMEQIQKEIDAAQGVVDQTIRELAVDAAV